MTNDLGHVPFYQRKEWWWTYYKDNHAYPNYSVPRNVAIFHDNITEKSTTSAIHPLSTEIIDNQDLQ